MEIDDALAALRQADIEILDSQQSLKEIGRSNSFSTQEVFNVIQQRTESLSQREQGEAMPETALPGKGNMSIPEL